MFGIPKRQKNTVSEDVVDALSFTYNSVEIAVMDRLGTRTEVAEGTVIAAEGKLGAEAILLLEGTADVSRDGVKVATVGKADIVGEGSLLTGKPRNASIVANTTVDLVTFTPQEFSGLLNACPRLDVQMKQLLEERVPA